jgi:hypothetical protein
MPRMYEFESFAHRKGLLLGIGACLDLKFGAAGLELMPEVHEIWDNEVLDRILHRIETADNRPGAPPLSDPDPSPEEAGSDLRSHRTRLTRGRYSRASPIRSATVVRNVWSWKLLLVR